MLRFLAKPSYRASGRVATTVACHLMKDGKPKGYPRSLRLNVSSGNFEYRTAAAAGQRFFSSSSPSGNSAGVEANAGPKDEKKQNKDETTSQEMKSESIDTSEASANTGSSVPNADDLLSKASSSWSAFTQGVSETWQELIESGKPKDINKKIAGPNAAADGYDGPLDIMVIDEKENLTAWERMQRRLTEAPIIQDLIDRSEQIYEKTGAKKVKQRVDHLSEDAREAWETSQNPWVYRISSVYETLTAESAESAAVRELRQLDPEFTLESWRQDVVEHTLPNVMSWFLKGNTGKLKPWLGESVFKRIAAEIAARKQEGVQIDTNILAIMNSEILACERDTVNKGSPIILLHFMCQQINCVRKKSDNSIVEGSEDDIRANSYVVAFQREYNEETGELNWKIVDFRFNGAIAYL